MRRGFPVLIVLIAAMTAALEASATSGSAGQPLTNTMCPVMPGEEARANFYADFDGQRIYFCCAICRRRFNEDPEQYREAAEEALRSAQTAAETIIVEDDAARPALRWIGRLHPSVVHFPIGLLLAAALAELIALRRPSPGLFAATRYCLYLGALTAVVAAGLGWLNDTYGGHPEATAGLRSIHKWLSYATVVAALNAAGLTVRSQRRGGRDEGGSWTTPLDRPSRIALFITATLVAAAGHYGGMIVFGKEYLAW